MKNKMLTRLDTCSVASVSLSVSKFDTHSVFLTLLIGLEYRESGELESYDSTGRVSEKTVAGSR